MAHYSLYRPWAADPWGALFGDLRRELDGVFQRYAGPAADGRRGVYPPVNLYETADAYVLTAELPGVEPSEIDVSLQGSTVTLSGQRKIEDTPSEGTSLHRRERQSGSFRRSFDLPEEIDADQVEAAHRNGVLLLRLPKSPETQPRRIAVTSS